MRQSSQKREHDWDLLGLAERATHAGGQDVRDPRIHLNSDTRWLIIFRNATQVDRMAHPLTQVVLTSLSHG
jgi:hypothetical protein